MADIKKIATREGYGEALVELGREHDNIVVFDADLAGSTKSGVFGKAFPGRHFNAGIAEADMICAAAGADGRPVFKIVGAGDLAQIEQMLGEGHRLPGQAHIPTLCGLFRRKWRADVLTLKILG